MQLLSLAGELISACISSCWLTALVGKLKRTALKLDVMPPCDFWSLALLHSNGSGRRNTCLLFKRSFSLKLKGKNHIHRTSLLQSFFTFRNNPQAGDMSEGFQRQNQLRNWTMKGERLGIWQFLMTTLLWDPLTVGRNERQRQPYTAAGREVMPD